MKKAKLEPIVLQTLLEHPDTRGDDFLLVCKVLENYVNTNLPLYIVLKQHDTYKIPSFASIIRTRRFIQAERPSLLPERKIVEIRAAEEKEYRDLARGK